VIFFCFEYTDEWHKILEEVIPTRNHKNVTGKNKRRKFKKKDAAEEKKKIIEENKVEVEEEPKTLDFFLNKIQKRNTATE
jgi:hypothetical protein